MWWPASPLEAGSIPSSAAFSASRCLICKTCPLKFEAALQYSLLAEVQAMEHALALALGWKT